MVHVNRDEVFGALRLGERFCHIVPFGMRDKGYDVGLPLLAMAKNINYVYNQCYNDHGDDTSRWRELWTAEIDRSRRETAWRTNTDLCPENRFSNIALAMTVSAKMRALGIADSDMRKFQDVTLEQIEVLAQVEHNRWSVDKLIAGFRPCTTDEQRAIESDISLKKVFKNDKKAHYDLRAYNDLRADDTDRSSEIYDKWLCASLPLIAAADDDSDGSTEGGEQP